MKLVKQTTLYFQEGKSDKVYQVDLCEVSSDQFLVNFRYGRRGSTLRDGTKTTSTVSRDAAEILFEDLVNEKIKKGYTAINPQTGSDVPVAQIADHENQNDLVENNSADSASITPQHAGVLDRLKTKNDPDNKWKLSRAIWRAGELEIAAAAPLLHALVGEKAMNDYCIAWSLGRIKHPSSVPALERLAANTAAPHVAHIATESLRLVVDEDRRKQVISKAIEGLPEPIRAHMLSGTGDTFQTLALKGLGSDFNSDLLNVLYFIDNEIARSTLLAALKNAPFDPPFFRPIRRIFKAAELRRDGQVFGLLAHRFEVYKSKFRVPSYVWRDYKKPTLGENPEHAFSVQTRDYFRRRIWWTLKRLGELADEKFVPMAVGILLPFTDDDARPIRTDSRYDYKTRSYIHVKWDAFGSFWAFNQLLHRHSPRYAPLSGRKSFRMADGVEPGSPPLKENEAAFVELWKAQPNGLLHLLTESRCQPVHVFAAKTLRHCETFCNDLPLDIIKILLASSYDVTVELAFDIAVKRYDANDPDFDLVALIANCPLERGRHQSKKWIEANRNKFFADTDFTVAILTSQYSDTRAIGLDSLFAIPTRTDHVQILTGRLIAFMQSATVEQSEIAADIGNALLRPTFKRSVTTLGENIICDLLASNVLTVQMFAASVVQEHQTYSRSPTERILRSMLDASHPPVRATGIKIISELPQRVLLENVSMLAGLICHELEDIRKEIRPLIKRLSETNSQFGRDMATELTNRLLIPGAPDGVPTHTSRVIREDLSRHVSHIESEIVWKLLHSRSAPAQEVGGFLLPTNVDPAKLEMVEIVKLARHVVLTVREASWKMYEHDVARVHAELPTSVRILDSPWEDSRQFGFQFFKENTEDSDLTPAALISICDSVRPDVQQFGREMITRRFNEQDGPEYLTKLSEHPAAGLQLFASNFLVEYGTGKPDRIKQLEPYFVSILSRVNQSRVAKDRVLKFLRTESVKDRESAETISRILDRISATCAIGDRAATIEAMVDLHAVHPDIELPIRLKPLEVR